MSVYKTFGQGVSLFSAALAAVVVGFASTIFIIIQAAQAVWATPAQQASWAAVLCFGMAATSFMLSYHYKMPIITAWSTPGAVLIATSGAGISYESAIGAFVVAALMMVATSLLRPALARPIERMPPAIAAAMLAGVLLSYVLKVPSVGLSAPYLVVPLIAAFFIMRLSYPIYAVPVVVALGLGIAAYGGSLGSACCTLHITQPVYTAPHFDWPSVLAIGVPLYLVTMASQNLPGFAVLKASGYRPPVSACLLVTGLGSLIIAPFGGHAVNMAAITASLVTGPEAHPDPTKRWLMVYPYALMYFGVGVAAMSFVLILTALPHELVTAIAGLALFGPLLGGVSAMMSEPNDNEPALATFLITASGFALFGVGAPFWGLTGGLALWFIKRWLKPDVVAIKPDDALLPAPEGEGEAELEAA